MVVDTSPHLIGYDCPQRIQRSLGLRPPLTDKDQLPCPPAPSQSIHKIFRSSSQKYAPFFLIYICIIPSSFLSSVRLEPFQLAELR